MKPDEIVVSCDSQCLETIRTFVRQRAAHAGLNETDVGRLVLAADEASSNIIRHSYHFDWRHKIAVGWNENKDRVVVAIRDDSPTPYLPSMADFDLPTKIRYRQASGYGKHLIRQAVDQVAYETVPGSHNTVMLVKFRTAPDLRRRHHPHEGASKEADDPIKRRSITLSSLFDVLGGLDRQKSPEELIHLLLYAIMGQLSVQAVVLLQKETGEKGPVEGAFRLLGQTGLSKRVLLPDPVLPGDGWVGETLWAHHGPFLTGDFKKLHAPPAELEILEKIRSRVLVPVFLLGELRGIVSLGEKRNHQSFSHDDMSSVTLLMSHLMLLLERLS